MQDWALEARERRWQTRLALARGHQCAVISLTLRAPQALRLQAEYLAAHQTLMRALQAALVQAGVEATQVLFTQDADGPCAFYLAKDAALAKHACLSLEQRHPLGDLADADVLDAQGHALSRAQMGQTERPCLVCGHIPARACVAGQLHSAAATQQAFAALLLRAGHTLKNQEAATQLAAIAQAASRAVLYEVSVTPKPGLVDREGTGAHTDMDFFTFMDSAAALNSYWPACARLGFEQPDPQALFVHLREEGKAAEARMLAATGGVNTHKGLIFSLGLLCAAAGMLVRAGQALQADGVCRQAAALAAFARRDLEDAGLPSTHGLAAWRTGGHAGARGEAAAGFPSARRALPALQAALAQGLDINAAGVHSLLHLMTQVADTNVFHRGGAQGLQRLQRQAQTLLDAGAPLEAVRAWGAQLAKSALSPGGSADLLAVTFFLHFLEQLTVLA